VEKDKLHLTNGDCLLFSVLIANYNNGKYLTDAINSVRSQTYTNWEIILVDDSSTDNSKELYKELELDERIHIFLNDCNHGCGYTKRRCVELANGDLCGFLDPDDALTNDALAIMVEAHRDHLTASLINSTYYVVDNELNVISISDTQWQIPQNTSFLECGSGISHFATFKRPYYLKTDGINQHMIRAVDQDLYLKLEEVGEIHYIDQPLYLYRCDTGNNISLGVENVHMALWWNVFAIANACIRRGLPVEKYAFVIPNFELSQAFKEGTNAVYQTKTYLLGSKISRPIKWIKQLLLKRKFTKCCV